MKFIGLDIETDDKHLTEKGASWIFGEGSIIVTGLYNARTGSKKAFSGNGGQTVKALLLDKDATLIGANIGYDIAWLCYEHNLKAKEVKCSLIDVAIAEACIDEYQPYSLDALAWKYLKERKKAEPLELLCQSLGYKGDFRKHLKKLWDAGYKEEIKAYVISDADQPVRIWEEQQKIIPEESREAVETNFKLIKITLDMKQHGVRIDLKTREKNAKILQKKADEIFPAFEKKHGKVNLNSPKQLSELFLKEKVPFRYKIRIKGFKPEGRKFVKKQDSFYGDDVWNQRAELKNYFSDIRIEKGELVLYQPIQYAERTADEIQKMGYEITCNPSLGKKALERIRRTHPIVQETIDLKSLRYQLDNFFGKNFDKYIVEGRIHPEFVINGARQTGRLSSIAPNGQNIPSRTVLFEKTEEEIKVYKLCRECFIPDEGMFWGKCDYAGQENRLMAHFAVGAHGDFIRQLYCEDPDFDEHDLVGKDSGLYEEHGYDVGRKYIKNYRFGKAYGMQIKAMMEYFGWSQKHAEHMDEVFSECAPWVGDTMDRTQEIILKRGYIKTLAGRHSHLQSFNGVVNRRSAYKAFNKLIQGSGADMMKKALVMLDEAGLLDVFPLYLTVHDEIDFGIPKKAFALKKLIEVQKIMENTFLLSVPIRVDPEIGEDWGHVKGRKEKKDSETGKVIAVESMENFIKRHVKVA